MLRDTKNTTSPGDDTFKVVFGGVSYDLVLVDSAANIYHTKDETFWKLQYNQTADYWTLTTKDGTTHRFGFNADSKAIAVGQDLVTQITYKYLLDEVKTTSGTSVRYSYFKQTARVNNSSTGQLYDQAVYPNTITYAYNSGILVGSAREIRFFRAPRTDYTDTTSSTHVSFFERDRLDAIEVWVGTSLVRKYVFGFDYSIDRDPTFTWGGGATGDLTLKSVTMYGTDGISALPALTFTYKAATEVGTGRLASANNGIGGTVSYSYEQVASRPIYSVCERVFDSDCWEARPDINFGPDWGCCVFTGLLGYALTSNLPGSRPIYSACERVFDSDCWEARPDINDLGADSCCVFTGLLGYVYAGKFDRHRVISRTLSDGLGWSSATNFTYSDLGLSADGKEFRGHGKVRSTDPLGHYTDTFFKQDDALRGRPYQIEARSSTGALFSQLTNTWSSANPFPGVTFAFVSRVDKYECDGGATCRQTAQTFTYDTNGNPTQTAHLGDVSVIGDERTENTDWSVDTAAWIHRPPATLPF